MPKETKVMKKQQEALEYEKQEDEFDKDRLYFISLFILRAFKYRTLAYEEFGHSYTFTVSDLEDGNFKFEQETSELIDCSPYSQAPAITTDTNSVVYNRELDKLNSEIMYIQNRIAERKRISDLKKTALEKLTKEEKEVLGL